MGILKMQVIGNLGKDCVKNDVNGKTVLNFSVAHTEKFKNKSGEQQSKTVWIDCSWWSDKTTIAQYLTKGTQVYVEGTPEVRTYESNGETKATLSMRVLSVQLLGGGEKQPAGAETIGEDNDSLPF